MYKRQQQLGFRWIAIHGRTRQQQYAGTADWAAIGELKARLTLPGIANGDVFAPGDAVRMLNETGADGVMIGRGAMGNPWLFREAVSYTHLKYRPRSAAMDFVG